MQKTSFPRSTWERNVATLRVEGIANQCLPLDLQHNERRASELPVPTRSVGTRTLQFP